MERAKEVNIKFNRDKFQYKIKEVRYLGNIFSERGMKPAVNRLEATKALSPPKDKKD